MENENDPSEKGQSDSTDQAEEQKSEDDQKENTASDESQSDSTNQAEEQKSEDEQKEKAEEKKMILFIVGGAVLLILLVLAAFFIFRKGDTQKVAKDKVQSEEVKGDVKISAGAFSYELWPFVNRSKNMKLLMPKLRKIEKELVEKIKSIPEDKKIIVYGYTSREKSKQNKKKEKGNIVLSTKRAKAIVKYLANKYKIDKDRFEIKGQGSKDLEVKKPTWSVRNRRVVITSEE